MILGDVDTIQIKFNSPILTQILKEIKLENIQADHKGLTYQDRVKFEQIVNQVKGDEDVKEER